MEEDTVEVLQIVFLAKLVVYPTGLLVEIARWDLQQVNTMFLLLVLVNGDVEIVKKRQNGMVLQAIMARYVKEDVVMIVAIVYSKVTGI